MHRSWLASLATGTACYVTAPALRWPSRRHPGTTSPCSSQSVGLCQCESFCSRTDYVHSPMHNPHTLCLCRYKDSGAPNPICERLCKLSEDAAAISIKASLVCPVNGYLMHSDFMCPDAGIGDRNRATVYTMNYAYFVLPKALLCTNAGSGQHTHPLMHACDAEERGITRTSAKVYLSWDICLESQVQLTQESSTDTGFCLARRRSYNRSQSQVQFLNAKAYARARRCAEVSWPHARSLENSHSPVVCCSFLTSCSAFTMSIVLSDWPPSGPVALTTTRHASTVSLSRQSCRAMGSTSQPSHHRPPFQIHMRVMWRYKSMLATRRIGRRTDTISTHRQRLMSMCLHGASQRRRRS